MWPVLLVGDADLGVVVRLVVVARDQEVGEAEEEVPAGGGRVWGLG